LITFLYYWRSSI